jgi:hypothetical protein
VCATPKRPIYLSPVVSPPLRHARRGEECEGAGGSGAGWRRRPGGWGGARSMTRYLAVGGHHALLGSCGDTHTPKDVVRGEWGSWFAPLGTAFCSPGWRGGRTRTLAGRWPPSPSHPGGGGGPSEPGIQMRTHDTHTTHTHTHTHDTHIHTHTLPGSTVKITLPLLVSMRGGAAATRASLWVAGDLHQNRSRPDFPGARGAWDLQSRQSPHEARRRHREGTNRCFFGRTGFCPGLVCVLFSSAVRRAGLVAVMGSVQFSPHVFFRWKSNSDL